MSTVELFLVILVATYVGNLLKDATLAAYVNYQSNKFRRKELEKLSAAREEIMQRLGVAADEQTQAAE